MNIIEYQWESMSRDPGSHCSPPELDLLKSPGGGRNEKSALDPDLVNTYSPKDFSPVGV